MKIVFLYKYFPGIGGVERVLSILANELVRQGHDVAIISFQQPEKTPFYKLNENIKLIQLPNDRLITAEENVLFLSDLLSTQGVDILFNHDSTLDSTKLVGMTRKRVKSNCKFITLHHGPIFVNIKSLYHRLKSNNQSIKLILFPLFFCITNIRRLFSHWLNMSRNDYYVTLAECFKKELLFNKKASAISNPLSFDGMIREEEIDRKENLVLMVGRISEWHKRFQMALDIWEHFDSNDDWKLIIVGDGPDFDRTKESISNRKLNNVTMVGQQDPLEYYKRAKILMLTSSTEGFPLVLNEAKQNGCVPIAMNSFKSVDVSISDGIDGYIVRNNDKKDFVGKINKLMTDEEHLKKMAEAAVVNSQKFSAKTITEKWINLFSKLKADVKN